MPGIITKMFIVLLNGSNHTKCVFWSNEKCMTQYIFINLHLNEYSSK